MSKIVKMLKFKEIDQTIEVYLESLEPNTRLSAIEEFMRRLHFEKRFAELTKEERAHMDNESLSPEMCEKISSAQSHSEHDEIIKMYARARYISRCAWSDYLNGRVTEKPFSSSPR